MGTRHSHVVDDGNHKIAVQLDSETFEKIETLENYGLAQLMSDKDDEVLEIRQAQNFYKTLEKAK